MNTRIIVGVDEIRIRFARPLNFGIVIDKNQQSKLYPEDVDGYVKLNLPRLLRQAERQEDQSVTFEAEYAEEAEAEERD